MSFLDTSDFAPNSDSESSIQELNSTKSSNLTKTTDYNDPDFKLPAPEDSPIYIFRNGLFIQELKPVIPNKEREMTIKCTL